MNNFENETFNSEESNSILFLYRSVDDILACFLGCDVELGEFLHFVKH